jgi:alpha/beta superfamily hydrolase
MADPTLTKLSIMTSDGLILEGERRRPTDEIRAAAVLCHPHPQYGGTMRSLVISALFDALPTRGVDCVRFNYRGVERSQGGYGDGVGERLDVLAAIDALGADADADADPIAPAVPTVPTVLIGWSFGADMVLATVDARISGWFAIAVPMRFVSDLDRAAVASDPRPKFLALAQHDEFRDAEWVVETTRTWHNTRTEVVSGASHFFVGRTDRLIQLADEFIADV